MDYLTYITSDLHFYHTNIIKYCNRPYSEDNEGLSKMNEDMLAAFDALPEGSTIINNGDICLNSDVTFEDLKFLVSRMKYNNKKLWIILGNHDRDIFKYIKGQSFDNPIDFFTELGFDRIEEFPIFLPQNNLLLSHEPIYLKPGTNIINVHGHTHHCPIDENYFNRDCDNWKMMEIVKKEGVSKQKVIEIDTSIKPYGKEVDLKNYVNVCWDYTNKIIPLRGIIRETLIRK